MRKYTIHKDTIQQNDNNEDQVNTLVVKNAIVCVFGLRNEFKNVHGNKKRNTGGVKGKFALTIFTLLTQQSPF